jgi:hypothetical protein
LTFTIRDEANQEKYLAFSRNVSTEGMCFVSHKQLKPGSLLTIEVYLESGGRPILMDGEVRWCRPANLHEENKTLFDSGIRLLKLNGASVFDSIHYNERKNAEWSNVLESIFGERDNLL